MTPWILALAASLHCEGSGSPTLVIEYGFGDTAAEWRTVQKQLAPRLRVCTYDRAGYAKVPAGPEPRTLDQLNLELREILKRRGEKPPFVILGHSFGGNLARRFAERHRAETAGLIFADAVHPDQPIRIGGKPVRLRELARGRAIPPPSLDAPPPDSPRTLEQVEGSQGQWSEEQHAIWFASKSTFGGLPLLVLSRTADDERLRLQRDLATLSSRSEFVVLACGHNFHTECPGEFTAAILKWWAAAFAASSSK